MKVYYNPHNATGKGKAKEKEKTMVNVFLNFCWIITVKSTTCNVALGLASWLRVTGCSLVWFGIVWRHDSMMLHGMVWYGTVWYGMVRFGGIIVWCCMAWRYGDKLVAL